jgi:hypothetical protein
LSSSSSSLSSSSSSSSAPALPRTPGAAVAAPTHFVVSLDLDFFSVRNPALRSVPWTDTPSFRRELIALARRVPMERGLDFVSALERLAIEEDTSAEDVLPAVADAAGVSGRLERARLLELLGAAEEKLQQLRDLRHLRQVLDLGLLLATLAEHEATEEELDELQGALQSVLVRLARGDAAAEGAAAEGAAAAGAAAAGAAAAGAAAGAAAEGIPADADAASLSAASAAAEASAGADVGAQVAPLAPALAPAHAARLLWPVLVARSELYTPRRQLERIRERARRAIGAAAALAASSPAERAAAAALSRGGSGGAEAEAKRSRR